MVLEWYGYKFLRINRFNIGHDPVNTLSERLTRRIGIAIQNHESTGVGEIKKKIEKVENGDRNI